MDGYPDFKMGIILCTLLYYTIVEVSSPYIDNRSILAQRWPRRRQLLLLFIQGVAPRSRLNADVQCRTALVFISRIRLVSTAPSITTLFRGKGFSSKYRPGSDQNGTHHQDVVARGAFALYGDPSTFSGRRNCPFPIIASLAIFVFIYQIITS